MKKFIYTILFSIFLIGCATTNVEQKPKISSENKKLEKMMESYAGYPELVRRGFDIHSLDYVSNLEEFGQALNPYFYNYEDGTAFDNHFGSENHDNFGYVLLAYLPSMKNTYVFFREGRTVGGQGYVATKDYIFGTKEELLAQGYIENETMFYYPINGEKDWVVGWKKQTKEFDISERPWCVGHQVNPYSKSYIVIEDKNFAYIKIWEHPNTSNSYSDFYNIAKDKDVIIVDLTSDKGGYRDDGLSIANKILSLKNKKIYALIGKYTTSSGEILAYYLKSHNPDIKLIGTNTGGCVRYSRGNLYKFPKLGFVLTCPQEYDDEWSIPNKASLEGIGLFPDCWAMSAGDAAKTINWDLGYNLLNDRICKILHFK
jgi:hypothetical protein